ncbi:MAG: alpha/beta fold hydrolase [Candidatus Mycalebacterium zealandia]|nr:MAG: alpha/beta fold hydrolase [Candidatus Mycalebacterium zealandia]
MPLAKVNGVNINYEEHGSGAPVFLIGGLGSTIESWNDQITLYSKHFRVIVFDNRGSGLSDKPLEPYSTEDMADDVVALAGFLGIDRASFVGKSMGGMIAQWIGIKYPENTQRLVMGCSSARRDEVGNLILETGRHISEKAGMGAVWLTALFLGYGRKYIEDNIGEIKKRLLAVRTTPETIAGYHGQCRACEGHDTAEKLHLITAPTLVMFGTDDNVTDPRRAAEVGELIPNAKVRAFEGSGHGFWRENSNEADSLVVDFLKGSQV